METKDNNWVEVFSSKKMHMVEMLKQLLESSGIETQILNQKDSTYLTFGDINLYVLEQDVKKCEPLVKQFKKETDID